jgi:hypothetical protein
MHFVFQKAEGDLLMWVIHVLYMLLKTVYSKTSYMKISNMKRNSEGL